MTDHDHSFDAKRLVQRHANAARALEHMYTEKNLARLKEIGEQLEAALAACAVAPAHRTCDAYDAPQTAVDPQPVADLRIIGWLVSEGGRVGFAVNDSPEADFVARAQPRTYFPIKAHPAAAHFVLTAIRLLVTP